MNLLSKKIVFAMFLTILLSVTNSYAQNENEKVDALISQKKAYDKKNKTSKVFKIQLYNGNESQAWRTKHNFNTHFPEYNIRVRYDNPEWKTQVGNFKTRLEADRVLQIIGKKFLGAIVLETTI